MNYLSLTVLGFTSKRKITTCAIVKLSYIPELMHPFLLDAQPVFFVLNQFLHLEEVLEPRKFCDV